MQAAGVAAAAAAPAIYLVMSGQRAERAGLALAERLRDALPGAGVLANMEGGSFKAQMKRADKSGAAYAVIVGDDEAARGVAAVKSLRTGAAQQEWSWDELPKRLAALVPAVDASGSDDGR
jgi:histidyl-tRNA synthetase